MTRGVGAWLIGGLAALASAQVACPAPEPRQDRTEPSRAEAAIEVAADDSDRGDAMSTPKGPPPKMPPKGGPPGKLAPGEGEVDPAWRERMRASLGTAAEGDTASLDVSEAGDAGGGDVAAAPAAARVIAEGRAGALPEAVPDQGALPMVGQGAGIEAHDGQRVRLRGRYVSVDARRAPVPPPVYRGHAAIELADGRRVYLFPLWRDESRRPLDEATRLEGRTVIAVGTLWRRAPEDPSGGASLIDPCLDPVEAIALD